MKLTKEEQEMLDGKWGEAVQKAMELLVALGECYGAEEMIPVTSAHLSAANPINAGKGGTNFIKNMAEKGGKFVIPTTTNPASLDLWAWKEMGFTEELYHEQAALSEAISKMGGLICNTCTPYLIGHVPRVREHIAWAESSAIVYANALLGSRSNKESGLTALMAGITGRTPAYGYHLDENRFGKLKIMVGVPLKGETAYATLGFFVGKIAQDRIPIFTGIPRSASHQELKCLGAALATSGSVVHYHVVGVTPEAPTEELASGYKKIHSSDCIEVTLRELKETEESLSSIGPEHTNLVVLGCPYASIDQIKNYTNAFWGRRIKKDVEVWILTARIIKRYAEDLGYVNTLESLGVRLVSNTCPATMPHDFFKKQGYRAVATDSPKLVYYISNTKDIPCYYGSLDEIIHVITTDI